MRIRHIAFALALGTAGWAASPWGLVGPDRAEAAVAIAYTLDELIELSPWVVVARATERKGVWEEVGGSRRIVTYTKLELEQAVYGKPDKTLWVRTLGGAVGRIGQQVAGEAQLSLKKSALLFLMKTDDGVLLVAGAAQGHYPLVKPTQQGAKPTLGHSRSLGTVLSRQGPSIPASDLLVGKTLEQAKATIREAKTRYDALDSANRARRAP